MEDCLLCTPVQVGGSWVYMMEERFQASWRMEENNFLVFGQDKRKGIASSEKLPLQELSLVLNMAPVDCSLGGATWVANNLI